MRVANVTLDKNILSEKVGGILDWIRRQYWCKKEGNRGLIRMYNSPIFRPFVGHYVCVRNIGLLYISPSY